MDAIVLMNPTETLVTLLSHIDGLTRGLHSKCSFIDISGCPVLQQWPFGPFGVWLQESKGPIRLEWSLAIWTSSCLKISSDFEVFTLGRQNQKNISK